MAKHLFASYAPGFKTDVMLDDGERIVVQFRNKTYETDNEDIANKLDEHIAKRGGGRMFRRVDELAALALVEQHKRSMMQAGATQGPIASQQIQTAMSEALKSREAELQKHAGLRDEFANVESLVMTEPVEQTRIQTVQPPETETEAPATDADEGEKPATTGIRIGAK